MTQPPSDFRHALVTGGAGFIGHHLVRALLDAGLAVTVLDDLSMGRRDNVPADARLVCGDVRDRHAVDDALAGVDCVFHEAAIVSIRASVQGFARDADVNLMGTINVLERMATAGVRKAVFASSMAVYADSPTPTPLPETAVTKPISPYGIAKLAAESYWLTICRTAGIEGTVLRYFNTYGPGQTPTPYVGVITIFINRLLAGEALTIFGDGEQRRDFVHVDDIVAANLAVLRSTAPGAVFNVGTGHATSVNAIARSLIKILAPHSEPRYAPEHEGEMRNAIASIDSIQQALGWAPSRPVVNFDDIVAYWKTKAPAASR